MTTSALPPCSTTPPDHPDEKSVSRSVYFKELFRLQRELVRLQDWIVRKLAPRSWCFSRAAIPPARAARSSASPSASIRASAASSRCPRRASAKRTQWYFQRYVAHLPAGGEIVLFDRCWYNRAGVERVMGFCTEADVEEFFRTVPEFERMLVRSGIMLIKYWFSITDDEQHLRFQMRIHDPLKQWKLQPDGPANRACAGSIYQGQGRHVRAHPHSGGALVGRRAADKKAARLNCINHLLSQFPYADVTPGGGVAHAHAQSQLQARGHARRRCMFPSSSEVGAAPWAARACSDGPETFRGRASFAAGPAQAGPAWSDIMAFPLTLLDLAGAVALLLWGSHMVQTGVQRALDLGCGTCWPRARSRTRAFLAGLGVTALLQSSTATGLDVTAGLSACGAVELEPALAVMLGANVGTTLVAQAFSFDIAGDVADADPGRHDPVPARDGATPRFRPGAIGLGLMFLALGQLLEIMTHLRGFTQSAPVFGAVGTEPVVDVMLGAALTWAAHSSIARPSCSSCRLRRKASSRPTRPSPSSRRQLGAAINPLVEALPATTRRRGVSRSAIFSRASSAAPLRWRWSRSGGSW